MKWLSLYDLTGIQSYIFGSNVLQENLGGSFLVKQASNKWLKEAAREVGAEFQWSGGGNAMVTADSPDQAKRVATLLSAHLHDHAPGLYVACAHQSWDGSDEDFLRQQQELHRQLNEYKASRWPPAVFDGAGVIEMCASTGEPAIWRDDSKWLGPAAKARLDHYEQARDDLQSLFRLKNYTDAKGNTHDLTWTAQFDYLGRSHGERSMLGVIHFDGNRMGERFKNLSLSKLCQLSTAVNEAGKKTLIAALDWVLKNLSSITDKDSGGFELYSDKDKNHCFPVRPIVYGGDDITLVCDGRIALDLAAELLRCWRKQTHNLPGGPAHACAGVAIVRVHYPFYRAYELAKKLCHETKIKIRKEQPDGASALDWEFIAGAGLATFRQRRDTLYEAASGEQLHARPYYVIGEPLATEPYRSWKWFRAILVNALQEQEDIHTRFKQLAGILYQGRGVTKIHLQRWRDRFGLQRGEQKQESKGIWLPEPAHSPLQDGFANNETPYLDAIELMDRVLPLRCYGDVEQVVPQPRETA
jgi:hypothetical protein